MKTPSKSFRIKSEIITQLQAEADKQHRTLSNMIETILIQYLETLKTKN